MSERKRKKRFFDHFGFGEEDFLFGGEPTEGGSAYSISVTYDEKGKPVVHVKTHGDVDTAELRRDIEQRYPGAKIEGLEKKPLIRIIDEEEEKKKSEAKKKR
jgi:hypothetical protein